MKKILTADKVKRGKENKMAERRWSGLWSEAEDGGYGEKLRKSARRTTMIKCGECRYNRRDWTNPNNPDYYCGNEDSENYGCATMYADGCEDGEEK